MAATNLISSNSSSGSQSPTSPPASAVPSGNPSPASYPLRLSSGIPDDQDSQGSVSARGTPTRTSMPLGRSISAGSSGGRGGCWTCRLRRKKCDEQRIGDSCQTCIRLKIDCLGWGTRRPDWMRDKQAVETYKAGIKAKLTEAGMIRGQPRPSRQQQHLLHFPESTSGSMTGGASTAIPQVPIASYASQSPFPASSSSTLLNLSPHTPPIPTPDDALFNTNPFSTTATTTTTTTTTATTTAATVTSAFDENAARSIHSQSTSGTSTPDSSSGIVEQHVFYYFQSVLPVQYIFASDSITNAIHEIIVQEPLGAVSNASCALASLHNTRIRISRGLEAPSANNQNSTATTFYDRAFWQLADSRLLHGQYSPAEAIAALNLIGYWLFSGGSGDWLSALNVAREWLDQSGINNSENPKMTIMNLNDASKFAAKATMWMDIFSSISLAQPPRFLSLYRRLFVGGNGFWARGEFDLRMDALMGCPDAIMLAIAEISALAHWKTQERRNGSLSVPELVRKGSRIQDQLRRHKEVTSLAENNPGAFEAGAQSTSGVSSMQQATPSASPALTSTSSLHTSPATSQSNLPTMTADLRRLIGIIFHHTATLYLHTVLSDQCPGVFEIRSEVASIIQTLQTLQPSTADRALVFPMFLAGCLTDIPTQREYIKHRLTAQDETFGNITSARQIMENVWHRRDMQRGAVNWNDVMRELGFNLLLV